MKIPMDNSLDHSSRERVQHLYNKNVELENRRRKAAQARVPSDPNAWQQMRENYEAIVLEDHAFSEQHEVEYALWQLHYRRIEELRAHFNAALSSASSNAPQNGKGSTRGGPERVTKIRTQFKTFLSEATGFYHDLMLKIRAKYGLPLGYFSDEPENQMPLSKDGNRSADVKKGLISCHRCLIYLGDLARYKGLYGEGDSKARDFAAASSYYMQASSLWPSSGNPHHQLAILASYSGDELVAIYRYFRSLAVDNPFTTARDNLIIAFEKNRQSYSQLLGDAKAASSVKATPVRVNGKGRGKSEARLQSKENKVEASAVKEKPSIPETFKAFSTKFVRFNGILFTRTSLETFGEVFTMARNDLLELLSSGPNEDYTFGSDASECRLAIVRLIAILIFSIHNANRESENQSYAEILQRSVLLQNAFMAIFEFMGHILERCVQLDDPSTSYLVPGIMVFVEWLACRQDIAIGSDLEEKQANARLFFWKHCIAFFNKLLSSGYMSVGEDEDQTCFFNMSRYEEGETANRLALSEDFELRGFVPLLPAQLILDFSRKHSFGNDGGIKDMKARIQRIIAAGKVLASVVRVGEEGIYFDARSKKFVIGVEPQTYEDDILANSLEQSRSTVIAQDDPVSDQISLAALQPMPQPYAEVEDEDEVIVFKPSMNEKQVDTVASNLASSQVFMSNAVAAGVDFGKELGSFSAGLDGFLLQNVFNGPHASIANTSPQHLPQIQPNTSNWLLEQGAAINGLANLNLFENGAHKTPEFQDHFEVPQPAAFSVPFPQSISFSAPNSYPIQVEESLVPSKFDSVMSSGGGIDNLSMKSLSVASVGLKKNPVSRPVRRLGPPPGFGSVPSKQVEEPFSTMTAKNENSAITSVDDYSWLDGYQLPSSNQSMGFPNSISHAGQAYHSVTKSNSSMGMVSFPFPGKQVPAMQLQSENQKGFQDHQFSDHMKLYQEQQQLQKGNHPSVALPQQYQGQSLWEGRFFV